MKKSVDQRFILAMFWSIVSAYLLFYILKRWGQEKEILTLIIGIIGGSIVGGLFGYYFGAAHAKKDAQPSEGESTTTVDVATSVTSNTSTNALPLILIASGVLLLGGCTTSKKAQDYLNKHPELAASYCGDKFPVRDSLGAPMITEVKPANNLDHSGEIDSLRMEIAGLQWALDNTPMDTATKANCASVINAYKKQIATLQTKINSLYAVYKPCLPDTVKIERTSYRENTAKVQDLQNKLKQSEADKKEKEQALAAMTAKRNKLIWWLIAVGGALGFFLFQKIRSLFTLPIFKA